MQLVHFWLGNLSCHILNHFQSAHCNTFSKGKHYTHKNSNKNNQNIIRQLLFNWWRKVVYIYILLQLLQPLLLLNIIKSKSEPQWVHSASWKLPPLHYTTILWDTPANSFLKNTLSAIPKLPFLVPMLAHTAAAILSSFINTSINLSFLRQRTSLLTLGGGVGFYRMLKNIPPPLQIK